MKLATIVNGSPDGRLVIVSRDGARMTPADTIAPNLLAAMERWPDVESNLQELADRLNSGDIKGEAFDPAAACAPMPRSWQWLDGSAFQSHGDLMSTVFGIEKLPYETPLMYQGISDKFLGPNEDTPFPSEADGIDFEGEFAVIVDQVPMGVDAAAAEQHIRLIVLVNDWSLRAIAPVEMKTGFGWVQAKPACSMAPIAVTPQELGDHWSDGRVQLPLDVFWNGERFGAAHGGQMTFSFGQLVAHAARTRDLVAGTIIGSGTVSNVEYREVGSSCIAERRGIELLDNGEPQTGFMRFGDSVKMGASLPEGGSVFGEIDQKVTRA